MAKSRMTGRAALEEARALLLTLKGQEEAVQKVLALLRVIEGDLRGGTVSIEPARRGQTPLRYVVERTALGETLAEYRPEGSSQPFRCPRAIWDVMIGQLTDAEKPLSAEEIAAAVEKRTGTRPGDHQFRVPLRLLTQIDPPLLTRVRARYSPAKSRHFADAAEKLWVELRGG